MKKIKKTPELRFPEFIDPWEQRKFDELVNRVSNSSTDKSLPCVEYEDIVAGQGVLNDNFHLKKIHKKGTKFKTNDILFGYLRPYLDNRLLASFNGIAVGDWWVLRSERNNKNFIFSLLQTEKFQSNANISIGTKMPRANWKTVSNVNYFVPLNIKEQEKIGDFFSNLDKLITLHQHKLDEMEEYRKGMMQKLFPRKGERVPKFRFEEFNDEWQEKKLKDILLEAPQIKPENPAKKELLTVKLHFEGIVPTGESPRPTKGGRPYFYRNKGELIIGRQNFHNGGFGIAGEDVDGLIASNAIQSFNFKENVNSIFLIKNMQRPDWLKRTEVQVGGTGQKEYSVTVLKNLKILVPSLKEQVKLGTFFSKLDQSINLQKEKIELLQEGKKGFMQKMFV